jgi:hypothetical protein
MKIRDEFLCPITYELMHDAVCAEDGHTYERSAIIKWLSSNQTSPKTGAPMSDKIVPNMNIKKLITDMIDEGGAGLYVRDTIDQDRLFQLRPESMLSLLCLGPPESEWNGQLFYVSPAGCLGGRRMPENPLDRRNFVLFKDSTISRQHFQIIHDKGNFFLRDLASACGTFMRIFHGKKKELFPGMIFVLGKHQFLVTSQSDNQGTKSNASVSTGTLANIEDMLPNAQEMMADAKELLSVLSLNEESKSATPGLRVEDCLQKMQARIQLMSESQSGNVVLQGDLEGKLGDTSFNDRKYDDGEDLEVEGKEWDLAEEKGGRDSAPSSGFKNRQMVITCFAPAGSPIQGKNYAVGPEGVSLGRLPVNDISLSCLSLGEEGEQKWVSVDSAVSAYHSYITMDPDTGSFYIHDGSRSADSKQSTNGTWYRLSGPQQESAYHPVSSGMEVLIGTVRFQMGETMTVSEHAVNNEKEK